LQVGNNGRTYEDDYVIDFMECRRKMKIFEKGHSNVCPSNPIVLPRNHKNMLRQFLAAQFRRAEEKEGSVSTVVANK
jgi:hypothetical protein